MKKWPTDGRVPLNTLMSCAQNSDYRVNVRLYRNNYIQIHVTKKSGDKKSNIKPPVSLISSNTINSVYVSFTTPLRALCKKKDSVLIFFVKGH